MKFFNINKIVLIFFVIVFQFLKLFKIKKSAVANLIFYPGKLGDVVCITPLFKALKENRPQEKLILIMRKQFADILCNNPYLDEIIVFESEKEIQNQKWLEEKRKYLEKYEINLFFNLNGNFEGGILGLILSVKKRIGFATAYDNLSQKIINIFYQTKKFNYDKQIKEFYFDIFEELGLKVKDKKNQLFLKEGQTSKEVVEFFKAQGVDDGDLVAGISVVSGKSFKRWNDESWIRLVEDLINKLGAKVFFFGTMAEKEKIMEIRSKIQGKTGFLIGLELKKLPFYLQKCQIFVSVDTGPLYVADALGVPVVDIMGPCNEINQRPENNYRLVLPKGGCKRKLITPTPASYYKFTEEMKECFNKITPEMVLAACRELLKK